MTEAPERIWAWDESGEACLLMGRNEGEWTTEPTKEGWATEYIRADLVDPAAIREAALREAAVICRAVGFADHPDSVAYDAEFRILALIQVSASQNDKKEG